MAPSGRRQPPTIDTDRLQRAYQAHTSCRRIALNAPSEAAMLHEFCRTAVEDLGYRMAWVGLTSPLDDRVHPVAHAGMEAEYLDQVHIRWSDGPQGQGPTGRAIRTGRPTVCQDITSDPSFGPWRDDALQRGYASSAAIPIFEGRRPIGALNLYASEPHAFEAGEVAMLEEVAVDLMLGMHRHRLDARLGAVMEQMSALSRQEAAYSATLSVAHDLANLLMGADYALHKAMSTLGATAANDELEAASMAVARAMDLVRHLRSLGRHTGPPGRRLPVAQVVRSSVPLLQRLVPHCAFSAEALSGRARVALSATDLERILVNLIVNAGQAMPGGGALRLVTDAVRLDAPRRVETGELAPGTYVRVVVSDQGQGIDPAIRPQIFDSFVTTKGEGGTGLGLSTVLDVSRQGGGEVDVDSGPEGTTFTVYLPAMVVDDAPATP